METEPTTTAKKKRDTSNQGERMKETHAVRAYLEALKSTTGHPRVAAALAERRIGSINEKLKSSDITEIDRLMLIQRRINNLRIVNNVQSSSLKEKEAAFAEVARKYSERQGIEYATWIEMKVPRDVLLRAGIKRK